MRKLNSVLLVLGWPGRWLGKQLGRLGQVVILLPMILARSGGLTGLLVKTCRVVRVSGFRGIKQRILYAAAIQRAIDNKWNYERWMDRYDTVTTVVSRKMLRNIESFATKPVISVVMTVCKPQPELLRRAIDSVREQIYPHWELCIAEDVSTDLQIRTILNNCVQECDRIKVFPRESGGHISGAANRALTLAAGEFITRLDQHDVLAQHALYWVAKAINHHSEAALLYSDEDKIDDKGRRHDPYFKCDWNYDLLLSQNFITRLAVHRTLLVREIGGYRAEYKGSHDHDLALHCSERLRMDQIVHIPRILYHRRTQSTSAVAANMAQPDSIEAGLGAISNHLARKNIAAEVLPMSPYFRVRYLLPNPAPRVSLIIPTYNQLKLIRECVHSILVKTDYPNYQILIVDNRSDDPMVLAYFESLKKDPRFRVLRDDRPFNFSAINNRAVGEAEGELVALINNDTEVITPGWLTEMVGMALQPGVGAVGARLWFPDERLQHAGIILGLGGVVGHGHNGLPRTASGYFGRATLQQTVSAVTAACLVVRKEIYLQAGGMDEVNLPVAFNDVDFCLRLVELGYRNVWTPYAELYHHESATRGYEDNPEKQRRFAREVKFLQQRWHAEILHDPAYSPNLTLDREDFSIAWPPRVEPLM